METWMHDAIKAAFEEVWTLIAGDLVIHVLPDGVLATVTGSVQELYEINNDVNDAVKIRIGTRASQVFDLTAGTDRTAAQVADDINATAIDFTALAVDGYVKLTSDVFGEDLHIETVVNNAYVTLGLAIGTNYHQDRETSLLTVMDDEFIGEGMVFDPAGIRDINTRDLCFLKSYLVAQGVSTKPTDHYKINGERWDFVENVQIKDALNPLGGIQDIIIVRVRRAVELQRSDAGTTWGYSP